MVKVVQFLEIGNLPKSQLNPCRSRKVMIKNLNFQFQRADQRTIFTTFLNFLCRYPAPKTPRLWAVPHMVKTTSILNLNRDENQMIFKNVFEFRLQISRSRDPPVCALSHMAIIVPIWDGVKTGGASTANEIRSRLPFENTHLSMKINISDATRSPIWACPKTGGS